MTKKKPLGTEASCYALEAIYEICPAVKCREDGNVLLSPRQCETLLRRFGWSPISEHRPTPNGWPAPSTIDTGDHVVHEPSGETWVVAYVRGDRLSWCGWPEGEASLSDCRLVRKATEADRLTLLKTMASGDGTRGRYAQERLKAPAQSPAPIA